MNEDIRRQFPITNHYAYLNHAAVSPAPLPVTEAVRGQLEDVQRNGVVNYRSWLRVKERARGLMAAMLGAARADQVAFMRNTSDSLSTVANGMKWNADDNIVTFRREFPSNVYPWLRLRDQFGVEVRMAPERDGRIDLDELLGMIDDRTRLVALSWVQYGSGFRVDLERIGRAARQHDALFVVDVIQGMGVLPLEVEPQFVDVAAGACHKWLLAPEGIGFLYLSDRARARISPSLVGWVSVQNPEDYSNFDQEYREGTLAWETGTAPTSLFHGLDAGLQLLNQVGIDRIAAYLEDLTDYLCERLASRAYPIISSRKLGEKSQIVCIEPKGGQSPMELYIRLKQQKIVVSPRGERLRIAPHFYNVPAEIDALVDALPPVLG